jgi:tetratricopeptide (TPR) repeat protein
MKRKKQKNSPDRGSAGYEHLPVDSDFYTGGSPTEQPLYQDKPVSESHRVRKTGRHQAVQGRRKETVDPREKMALLAILKSVIMILLLCIAFFMLWKGIKLYEESIWVESQEEVQQISPVMQEVALIEEFDVASQDAREMFAERIEIWKEADRLVRSADSLLKRNNYDQAIERCQDALQVDPAHMGALERLGNLYFKKGMNVESINAYTRLLSVDPSRADLQEKLIQVLDAYGDAPAVVFMARWFHEANNYDGDVQRYMANALYLQNEYADAAKAYERVLKDSPKDVEALEKLANSHIHLEEYDKALTVLEKLRESNYRDQNYYQQIAVCNAQLGKSTETVQTLGKAAHLFGQNIVVGWIQDPRLDPVREDRTFQAFATRVGGEEFRLWLEKVAKTMDGEEREDITPQLSLPENDRQKDLLLKPNR